MNESVRTLAIVLAASLLVLAGVVAAGQRATTKTDTADVTWKDVPGSILTDSIASAGTKVVKDAETGRLRPAQAGELPESAAGRPTQIINSPDGSGVAIVGDDLLSESIAVKQSDGSIRLQHDARAATHAEVK